MECRGGTYCGGTGAAAVEIEIPTGSANRKPFLSRQRAMQRGLHVVTGSEGLPNAKQLPDGET